VICSAVHAATRCAFAITTLHPGSNLKNLVYEEGKKRGSLQEGLSDHSAHPDDSILFQEIRAGCTLGMLLCLDRPHRLAYILGEILEIDGNEASAILGVRQVTFRKRLERARAQIVEFMQARCGLANPKNACRCRRRLKRAVELKRVDRQKPLFARDPENARKFPEILVNIRQLEEAQRAVALFRAHPECALPNFTIAVRNLLNTGEGAAPRVPTNRTERESGL